MPARILVVEDNEDNLQLLTFLLAAFGHTVMTACDGEEGLAVAQRELPDLILCDLQMPKVNGYQMARALRKDPRFAKCPLIAVSAFAMRGDRERGLEAGFDGYVSKPIIPEEFVQNLEGFLDKEKQTGAPVMPASSTYTPSNAPHRATVLAVDNMPVNLRLLQSILEPFGYKVVTARTVHHALEILREHAPDLIISDLHMPDKDGFEFFQALTKEPGLSRIPFMIISSTLWPKPDLERAQGVGIARFIARPIEPAQLLAEIEACLASAKQ